MLGTKPAYPSRGTLALTVALAVGAIWLVVYSQTRAFVWDEGFHLVAAERIAAGKIPYLDFCFPQTPLNAYLNAALLSLFGMHWQVTHLVAALFVAGSAALAAEFVVSHFPEPDWNIAGAVVVALSICFNRAVTQFGPVAQAYGICLFLSVAAFRATIAAANRSVLSWVAGLLAGCSAAASLLTAPVAPVLLLWLLVYGRSGTRVRRAAAFLFGALLPFLPVLWLYLKAPRQVFFNIVEYQALYRRANWPGATLQDLQVLSGWLLSTQALVLGGLAVAGLYQLLKSRDWEPAQRAEFWLAAWLAAALGLFIATAHPTFERYFVFLVPFVSILGAVGLYRIGTRLAGSQNYVWPAAIVGGLMVLSCGRAIFEDRDATDWYDYQKIAQKVGEVTPPGARFYADELVYFILRRPPPSGMEFSYSHNIQLSAQQEALLHVVSTAELKQQIKAGQFSTVENCKDDVIENYQLPALFPHREDVEDCSIFWGKVKASH
jgi:hypothetical protein